MFKMIAIASLALGCALAETSVPKDATQVEPGVYKHTDSKGKTFIYRKTPFGVVKSADEPVKASETKPIAEKPAGNATPFGDVKQTGGTEGVRVTERGDSLEFERPSPFGSYKWKTKKTELTAEEREAWDRSRNRTANTGSKE